MVGRSVLPRLCGPGVFCLTRRALISFKQLILPFESTAQRVEREVGFVHLWTAAAAAGLLELEVRASL